MKTKVTIILGSTLLAPLGGPEEAQLLGLAEAASVAAKPLDIAGVRPGMAADEAAAILKRDGWAVKVDPGLNWEETVNEGVVQRKGGQTSMFGKKSTRAASRIRRRPRGGLAGSDLPRRHWAVGGGTAIQWAGACTR